jgi:AcrR family transcriptional regulator
MTQTRRRWQRRKQARPAEIIQSALSAFAEKGFAAAKLDDIARDAGVAKGTLYLHFETKEDLFRAVVRTAIAPQIDAVKASAEVFSGPFSQLAPRILLAIAKAMEEGRLPALVKMVVGESHNFPDLARIWHDDVLSKAIGALSGVIARAQSRGELRAGDPRLHVFSLLGPMFMAVLYRSVFAGITNELPDLKELAAQHAKTALAGMLTRRPRSTA